MEKLLIFSKVGRTSVSNLIAFSRLMVLFTIDEKINNPSTQTRDIFDLVRLCVFRPAQCNFYTYHEVPYLLHWNVLGIALYFKHCMTHTGRLDEGVHRYIWSCL